MGNTQLKDIAKAQGEEMRALVQQLEGFKARTFPMLSPNVRSPSPGGALAAPDLRLPRTPSPSAGAHTAGGRPYSVPVGKSRPMYGLTPEVPTPGYLGESRGALKQQSTQS